MVRMHTLRYVIRHLMLASICYPSVKERNKRPANTGGWLHRGAMQYQYQPWRRRVNLPLHNT